MKRDSTYLGPVRALAVMIVAATTIVSEQPGDAATQGPQRPPQGVQDRFRRDRDQRQLPQRPEQPAIFAATVSRVRVDVIVTDEKGAFVADLGADDFEVYEDGDRQEILDVQLVDLAAGEVHPLLGDSLATAVGAGGDSAAQAAAATPTGAGAESRTDVAADATPGNAASELGAVIFLIDTPSLSLETKARFGDAWQDLLEQTATLNVPRAAYMVDTVGRLEELAPLGHDLEAMREAARAVREAPGFGTSMRRRLIEIAVDMQDPDLQELAQAKARTFEAEERSRSLATYALLTNFADALWTRSGRTAVVWISSGIKLMQGGPYTALVNGDTGQRGSTPLFDVFSPDVQIKNAQERLHQAANGANVSIYTVDPTPLTESRSLAQDPQIQTGGSGSSLGSNLIQQSLDGMRDSMRLAASETGGKSFIHSTDIAMVLEEIERDTSRFYLVSYAPPEPEGDGEYHEIRVEVSRDDVDVRARSGYVDHPPDERARRLLTAALALPGSVTDLPVDAQVFVSQPPSGDSSVMLAVAIEGTEVGIMYDEDGNRRVSLDVHSLVLDNDSWVHEAHEQLFARGARDSDPFRSMPTADGQPIVPTLVGFLVYRHEWTIEPGSYTINVAVLDNVTGRVGATSVDVDIAEPGEAWDVGDPLLVAFERAGEPQPIVSGKVFPGREMAAFVEVYRGQRPILSGQVFRETAGGVDPDQSARLFPMPLRAAGAGLHRGSVPLPPGMPPGRYIVQLVITDPVADAHRILRVPLEVVEPPGR